MNSDPLFWLNVAAWVTEKLQKIIAAIRALGETILKGQQ